MVGVEVEFGAEFLESDEVGVETPATDLVAAGFGHIGASVAGQQRAGNHHRAAQPRGGATEFVGLEVVEVDLAGLERVAPGTESFDFDAHGFEQPDELHDVDDLGNIVDRDLFGGQQHGAYHFERFVLGPLRDDLAGQGTAPGYFECSHKEWRVFICLKV